MEKQSTFGNEGDRRAICVLESFTGIKIVKVIFTCEKCTWKCLEKGVTTLMCAFIFSQTQNNCFCFLWHF